MIKNKFMKTIYNEIWISLVLWKWNWIWLSYEIEEWNKETRWLWWKKLEKIRDFYFRWQFLKKMLILSSKDWIKLKNKDKFWFKIMFWFSNKN